MQSLSLGAFLHGARSAGIALDKGINREAVRGKGLAARTTGGEAGGADNWALRGQALFPGRGVAEVFAGGAIPSKGVESVAAGVDVLAASLEELPGSTPMSLDGVGLVEVVLRILVVARCKGVVDILKLRRERTGIGVTLVRVGP